jgi:hypothetical protein
MSDVQQDPEADVTPSNNESDSQTLEPAEPAEPTEPAEPAPV